MDFLKYKFNNKELLESALCHRSVLKNKTSDTNIEHNQRLEFLGDAVLSLVTANYLFQNGTNLSEGELSRLRAQYVCQDYLSAKAKEIKLDNFIKCDKAMRKSGGASNNSVLADALEAIFGAVFLDGGLEQATKVIFDILGTPELNLAKIGKDAKTILQEYAQKIFNQAPKYILISESGPPHAPKFTIAVEIKNKIFCQASGENKKIAAQNAARGALLCLDHDS